MTVGKPIEVHKPRTSPFRDTYFIALALIALSTRVYKLQDEPYGQELDILEMIENYQQGEFFIDSNPPLVTLMYYHLTNIFGKNILILKYLNTLLGTLTILLTYLLISKQFKIQRYLSFWATVLLSLENCTIVENRTISVYNFYSLLIILFISLFKKNQLIPTLTLKWFKNVLISSIILGLCISAHFNGYFILLSAMLLCFTEFWFQVADPSVSYKKLWWSFLSKIFANLAIPIVTYLLVWNYHFSLLDSHGKSYDLVSPMFQNSLDNNHLSNLDKDVFFGSTIMMRNFHWHNYIHSHNDNFRTGHQQVTGYWNFNDMENLFRIETNDINKDVEFLKNNNLTIRNNMKVRLFHEKTESYLRIDPQSRPPVTEQEYNSEVTTTKNIVTDESEENDNSIFIIMINPKKSVNEESKHTLKSLNTKFQLYNKKNNCYILANGVELTEGLSKGQTELICIKEPVLDKSLWFVDYNQHPKNKHDYVEIQQISYWGKLIEVLKIMIQDNIRGKFGLRLSERERFNEEYFGSKLSALVYSLKGLIVYHTESTMINQIPNSILLNLIVVSISGILLKLGLDILLTNPLVWDSPPVENDLQWFNYQSKDTIIVYLCSLLPLIVVKHPLLVNDYIPSTLIGLVAVAQFMYLINYYTKKGSYILILTATALVALFFWKTHPVIYNLNWTVDACEKIMVVSTWAKNVICISSKFLIG